MDERFLRLLKDRALRCVRDDGSVAGLAYCAVSKKKSMLCFSSWPYETTQGAATYVSSPVQSEGDKWKCGIWTIEINSIVDGEAKFCPEMLELVRYEKKNKVDFATNMALADEVLKKNIREGSIGLN